MEPPLRLLLDTNILIDGLRGEAVALAWRTTSGLLATWTFNNNPSETIQVWAGPAAPAAAPGPLPLMGAGAAYAFSRLLRSRIRSLGSQAKP